MTMEFQKKDNKFSVHKITVSFDTKCFKGVLPLGNYLF